MTQGLENIFNITPMKDVLNDPNNLPAEDEIDPDADRFVQMAERADEKMAMIEGRDHAEAMDMIHNETLQHARDVMELAFNVDIPRAARLFEVATGLYTKSIDAKNSKRDAQLKAMKLALDQRRLDLIEQKSQGENPVIEGDATIVMGNRNDLIKQIRESRKS